MAENELRYRVILTKHPDKWGKVLLDQVTELLPKRAKLFDYEEGYANDSFLVVVPSFKAVETLRKRFKKLPEIEEFTFLRVSTRYQSEDAEEIVDVFL